MCTVDGLGNTVSFLLSGGRVHDSKMAIPVLETINIAGSHVIADRAYGTQKILTYIEKQKTNYVIQPKKNVNSPWNVDLLLYKEYHLVEYFFRKSKQFRHIATRYDKLAVSFLSFIYIAAITILLK